MKFTDISQSLTQLIKNFFFQKKLPCPTELDSGQTWTMSLTGKYGASKRSMGLKIPNAYHPENLRRQWQGSKVTVKSEYRADTEYPYTVRLDWENNPYMEHWNEVCAWTVEHMGLPGDRYRTEITKDYMIWYFIQPEDQLVMTLAWGNDNGTDI